MPEIKNTFLGGKMNKDLDERLIPKNEYRDALNIEVSTSQGDDVGSLQNTFGNTAQSALADVISGGECIGSIVDKENDKIYWFIKGDNVDAIAEYDAKLRTTTPVLVDFGMEETYTQSFSTLDLNPNYSDSNVVDSSNSLWTNGTAVSPNTAEGISWNISNGKATAVHGRVGSMFLFVNEIELTEGSKYEIEYDITLLNTPQNSGHLILHQHGPHGTNITLNTSSTGTKKTTWIQGDNVNSNSIKIYSWNYNETENCFSIDNIKVREVNRFLKFSNVKNITGINILDGMLFWTDGENEPKKINIERCKAGSYDVVNFGSTSFIGPELISNGSVSTNLSWILPGGTQILSNALETVADFNSSSLIFSQQNVSIKKGHTYLISVDLGGSFTQGAIAPFIADELGGTTLPTASQYSTSTGTYTWTITAGVTDSNSVANPNGTYTAGVIGFAKQGATAVKAGLTFDNISVKEVAFDWNRTTKIKNSLGVYERDIKEEDITLIKRYPINAPDMQLIGTTKPDGSVINTSCETPTMTTFQGNTRLYNSGSGDKIRYFNFVHAYLREDAVLNTDLPEQNNNGVDFPIMLHIGPDWENIGPSSNGTSVDYPLYTFEPNPTSVLVQGGASVNVSNSFTAQPDYYKNAWQEWVSINHRFHHHLWCVNSNGDYEGGSSITSIIDKIGGRVWINTSKSKDQNEVGLWKKGDRIVLGYWNYNNNRSFWTYIDGDGATRVKPPGTRTIATTNPDGTLLRDDYGGFGLNSPTIVDAAVKAFNRPGDFGGGWSVVDGEYVGAAHTTTADVAHGSNIRNLEYLNGGGGDSFQELHSVVTGLLPNTTYNLYFNVNVTQDNSPSDKHPFGIIGIDPITGVNIINGGGSRGLVNTDPHLVLSGEYRFNYLWTTPSSNETSLDLSIFKRNDCAGVISAISIDYKSSNPIQIHPLVFSPKPDYEVGDLVEMVNSNKAPNGDDIKVVVKLTDEIQNGSSQYRNHVTYDEWRNADGNYQAPESWYDDITVGSDTIDDSDFNLDGTSAFAGITGFSTGGDLNTSSTNSADWSTSLEMISNGSFTGNSEGWSEQGADIEYLNYNLNNLGIDGTNAGTHDFPSIRQSQVQNPRLFWEENGEYTISFDHTAITFDTANGGGIYIRPENTNYFGRTNTGGALFNDAFVGATNTHGGTIPAGTVTGLVKWDHSSVNTSTATGFGKVDKNAIRVVAICDDINSRSTTTTVDNVSVLANKNENRITWGSAITGGGCLVIAGTTSQIMSYPQNPSGAKATGGVDFSLTAGEYYKLKYTINTNTSTAVAATIRLFDCDAWGQTESINSNAGDIQLSTEVGTHYTFWKQSKNATQLHVAFGPGFAGKVDSFEVFPVTVNNNLDYGNNGSNDNRKIFNTEIISIDQTLTQLPIEDHKYWSCKLLDQEPLFKKVFPRFCYRWKYQDGEYSALSAFTEVAFLPNDTYKYDANDGYNLSMENTVRRVILSSFDNRPSDVVEIDILYKESNSNNIYTFKTIKGAELNAFTEFVITKEKFHSLIESKQILRPYDNIPLKAKAQEISANRIIFGNYTQQYDISPTDEPIISTSVISKPVEASKEAQRSVKSLREYQVGIAYLDRFGRQSPVFSSENASFRIEQQNSSTANTISAQLTNKPPSYVSHYKYYVKDSAASFHNISLDRFYQAEESDHVWLSFPSSDFNKIREDDYLVLKKQHNSDNAVLSEIPIKYKVLSVKGNAPQFIKMTRKNVGGKIFNTDGKGLEFHSQSSYGGGAAGYPQKDKITFRIKGNIVFENKALLEAFMDNQTGRYIRIGRQITNKPSLFSNYYEILHISRVSANDLDFEDEVDYYEVTLVQPLGHDASFVGSSFSTSVKLFLEYYREELDEFDNHFEGKFFVKIAKNNSFERFIGGKQKVEDSGFNIVNAQDTHWIFQYEDVANAASNKGQDTDNWLKIRSLAATSTAEINSLADGNFDWTPSNTEPLAATTPSVYNATAVTNFPALHDTVVEIDGTDVDNPFTVNWAGTVGKAAFGNIPSGSTTVPQRFCIDQTHTFWMSRGTASYEGENTLRSNSTYANGFVMGNNYCSFTFMGIGEIDLGVGGVAGSTAGDGTDDAPDPTSSDIDTNTWHDGSGQEISPQWFDNFSLIQQMTTVGTQFRWHSDPTHTVYTIKSIKNTSRKMGYHRQLPSGGDFGTSAGGLILSKDRENFGYRIDIMLDKNIQWSPTATINSGTGLNASGSHNRINPLTSSSVGTTSQIQILERRPNELTHTSFNPAVFEIEPKERADLNLYYETPKSGMVLKNGMYIEALNNVNVNDLSTGGNYTNASDVGTIYKPSGNYALPYTKILGSEIVANPNFEVDISNYAGNGATGLVLTHIPSSSQFKITTTPSSGQYPNVNTTPSITLVDGQRYQVVADVYSMDNDVSQVGGTTINTKIYFITSDNVYRPFSNVALTSGINVIDFVYDATQATNLTDSGRLQVELTNTSTPAFSKEIIFNSISMTTLEVDETKPAMKIKTGSSDFSNPNDFSIDQVYWSPTIIYPEYSLGQNLPNGITVRISEIDEGGGMLYFKDYLLDGEMLCDGNTNLSTLPPQQLAWHNCFSFGNGVESNRLRDDFNAVTIDKGARVSTTLEETYKQEVKGSGLIFSGIYNSTSSTNQLNQFIQADSITKDLNPEYGTVQKLFTRNTNVVALCENKILKILANKDALFNADGSMQVTSSNSVLGQAIPFVGEYGISRNPESFANFGYRVYFTDRDRGAVLRLSADGLTPISDKDMISFFKSNLPNSNVIVGSYDENRDAYNVSLEDFTISFSENVNGWTSRKSFTAQSGVSLNGEYYTLKNSDIWRHHSNALRNNFYGVQYESSVKFMFNDIVDEVKNFNTLNYEGSQSREYSEVVGSEKTLLNNGWYSSSIKTDLETAEVVNFIDKEGKKFNNITGLTKNETSIDIKDFTSQGLGTVSAIDLSTHLEYKTLQITAVRIINNIGNDQKEYIVNTSPTDKTQEVTTLSENFEEGSNPGSVQKKFYIHANTVNGIKYAVSANKFNVSSSSGFQVTLLDLGSGTSGAGYHGNIVEVAVLIDYSSGAVFPATNVESQINVQGSPTLAIDN